MEIIGIVSAIIGTIFLIMCAVEYEWKNFCIVLSVVVACQLTWLVQAQTPKVEIEAWVSNRYQEIVFEEPVGIIKKRTFKPFSAITDKSEVEIYFLDGGRRFK